MFGKSIGPFAFAFLCSCCMPGAATAAETYPNRPVRVVVPFPPGGSDTVARILARQLSASLGQQFVIDNRPGAASTLGTAIAAKARPDGYTIMFTTVTFTMSAAVYANLPYDAERDFVAVAPVSTGPMVLVTPISLPVKSVKDFIALASAKPGQLNYATGGEGGINHLATEKFMSMAGIRMTHVPYKGSGPAKTDLLAGQVQLMIDVLGSSLPLIQGGRLRALAVTSERRTKLMPDVPTVAESGVPRYQASTWYGVLAPRGVPQSIIALLNEHITTAVKDTGTGHQLAELGFEPLVATPAKFAELVRTDLASWARTAQAAKIRLN